MTNIARLTALIGPARVKDIIFTARLVEAREALEIGLLTEIVEEPANLQSRADELAHTIAGMAPLTLQATKEAVRRLGQDGPGAGDEDGAGTTAAFALAVER